MLRDRSATDPGHPNSSVILDKANVWTWQCSSYERFCAMQCIESNSGLLWRKGAILCGSTSGPIMALVSTFGTNFIERTSSKDQFITTLDFQQFEKMYRVCKIKREKVAEMQVKNPLWRH